MAIRTTSTVTVPVGGIGPPRSILRGGARIRTASITRQRLLRRRVSWLRFQLDHELVELASELERHLVGVVLDDRRAGVLADVKHLVERETTADRTLDLALGHLLAVHAERVGVALANAPAVVVDVELAGR